MDKELGFDEKWEKCELSVQAYNHSFKSPEMKKKRKQKRMGILLFFFLLELLWFFLVASGKYGLKTSTAGLWLPIIILFVATIIIMFTTEENQSQKEALHIQWLRNRIMPVLSPQFQYVYENKTDVKTGLMEFYKEHVDTGAEEMHYFGCLMNETIDIYEFSIYNKEKQPSFFGVCILLPDDKIKNKCTLDRTMEKMEKQYYAFKNIEEGFHVVYKDNNFWIFCSEVSFDNFMDSMNHKNKMVPNIAPINAEQVKENYIFLNSISSAIQNGVDVKKLTKQ